MRMWRSKKWCQRRRSYIRKNGRVVTQETKKLFEQRTQEFKKRWPTPTRAKSSRRPSVTWKIQKKLALLDQIPVEVWKNSVVVKEAFFKFLQKVWSKEQVPVNLVVCEFVMIFKNKGSQDDYAQYRAIGIFNCAYKILNVVFLHRLIKKCEVFFSECQAGFRCKKKKRM